MAQSAGRPAFPDGFTLHRFSILDSTNAEALRRLSAGTASPGDIFVADMQDAGRGRSGRTWNSPSGNLHCTAILRPHAGRPPAQLAFVAALGTLDALRDVAPSADFALKWPNDTLCSGRKVSGVLIEGSDTGYAVGIGINLVAAPPDEEVRFPAISLRDVGATVSPDEMTTALCIRLDRWHRVWGRDGFEPLRRAWLESAHRIGDTIAASTGKGTVEGRFVGLDPEGALIIDAEGGRSVVSAGDVFFPGDA